jgi:succinyldiaminopimelate transaminase
MINDRLERVGDYPFDRLRALLNPIAPKSNLDPIVLSIGEPQHKAPDMLARVVHENAALWGKYPPMKGTPEYRAAVVAWLERRYRLPAGMVDPERHVLPVSGTREALFLVALAAIPEKKNGAKPVALMPNPFYQVYAGAAVLSGAEPHFLPAVPDNGFMPDLADVPADVLERTALAYVCSPANPQGAVASLDRLKTAITLARKHDFLLVADECYSEIYDGAPPPGALEACAALGGAMDHVMVFQSLSKRSSAPGLRSGFVAGDEAMIKSFGRVREYGGVAPPLPLLAAATALWGDEAHVAENRALYRQKFDMAEQALGGRLGFYRPAGGFYLWLDVGDGEKAAAVLWRQAAVRVMPGAYLARAGDDGVNPGNGYIRCALVHELDATAEAIERISRVL